MITRRKKTPPVQFPTRRELERRARRAKAQRARRARLVLALALLAGCAAPPPSAPEIRIEQGGVRMPADVARRAVRNADGAVELRP